MHVCRPQKQPHSWRTFRRLSWGPCLAMAIPGMQPQALALLQLALPSALRGRLQSSLRERSSEVKLSIAAVCESHAT